MMNNSLNWMRSVHRETLRKAKFIHENKMGCYEWENKILLSVGRKWVYYSALNKDTNQREDIKLLYDKSHDWEFEREKI